MLSLSSQFELLLAEGKSREAMTAELQYYFFEHREDNSITRGLRTLDSLRSLGRARENIQVGHNTPEQIDWLRKTKAEAERFQLKLDEVLRQRICETALSTASKDEYNTLVTLLFPPQDKEHEMSAGPKPSPSIKCGPDLGHAGHGVLEVKELVTGYIQCTLAIIDEAFESSRYQPTPLLWPASGREGAKKKRSFRDFFRQCKWQ